MSTLRESVLRVQPHSVALRHDLHTHPELGYKEHRTSQVVQEHLAKIGVTFKGGLAGGTGVLGWLPATVNPSGARTVALRADMDALPILERTGLPYESVHSGVMHACGHDGHTTILMTAAEILQLQPHRPNNVLLIFQPAEEGGAGQGGAPGLADGRGCLLSCFPTCQRPAYRAGQVITGHLMVRPVSRIVISGA